MHLRMKTLSVCTLAALGLLACGKEEPKPAPPPPPAAAPAPPPPPPVLTVKIGHAAPLTGPQAHLGKDNENGARMAIDDANEKGMELGGTKVKFELMGEDDQADPKTGTTVAQKLIDAKVNGIVGHLNSGTTIPASKLYMEAGIPEISPSATNPTYTEQGFKTAFRVMSNDVQQGKALGEYAVKNLKKKSIAIIDDRSAYGQGLADQFQKAAVASGAKIVTHEYTSDKETDFAAILTKVKSKKPDLVFYGGMDAQAGPMAKQLKTLGIKAPMLFGDGGCTTEFHKLAGDAAAGNYCSLPGVPLEKMPGGADFKARYKTKFNTDIQLYAPYAYDAAMVMIDAMKRANSADPAKYLAELAKTTDYSGVTAKISFDDKGDVKDGAVTLYQAKDGQWMPLETVGGAPMAQAVEGAKEAVKEAAAEVKDAAKDAAKATGDMVKEGVKSAAEAVKSGAEAVKSGAEAAKSAVEKK
ncbi:MAG: branched-chain amino acid ABC transporter substrate-binding protein [Rhodocyclaceae bacterium]|nr:branched-chain amino acid ABC transporter substrate-binding protein [Rhodocyclaceae bacterium]MBX3668717.1 branched-chain amino acid ABC transporter substrate-binding protein [Rhodocyclaceae bacterium]